MAMKATTHTTQQILSPKGRRESTIINIAKFMDTEICQKSEDQLAKFLLKILRPHIFTQNHSPHTLVKSKVSHPMLPVASYSLTFT